jgi:hypothetical protein
VTNIKIKKLEFKLQFSCYCGVFYPKGRRKIMFENEVLTRIIRHKTEDATGCRKKVGHAEELHNLYSKADIIRMIKSRKMIVACTTDAYKMLAPESGVN